MKNEGMGALLRRLLEVPPRAKEGRRGRKEERRRLLILTTRWPIKELNLLAPDLKARGIQKIKIERLEPHEGGKLLECFRLPEREPNKLDCHDDPELFHKAAETYGGHPLALVLLASYLVRFCQGDLREHDNLNELVPHDDNEVVIYRHARRVMTCYDEQFERESSILARCCLRVLCLLGLFVEPAPVELLDRLRRARPPIEHLTDGLNDSMFQQAVGELRRLQLLAPPRPGARGDVLDAHGLVRQHYARKLRVVSRYHAPSREAHKRLFHLLCDAPELPEDMQQMAPLLDAVRHGVQAGLASDAFTMFQDRIMRGHEWYSIQHFHAVAETLTALSRFFEPRPDVGIDWGRTNEKLSDDERLDVLLQAGALLLHQKGWAADEVDQVYHAASQLVEGKAPNIQAEVNLGLWSNCLVRGNLKDAEYLARRLLRLAKKTNNRDIHISSLRAVGSTAFWLGQFKKAEIHLRACIEMNENYSYKPFNTDLATNPSTIAAVDLAHTLWALGRNEEALKFIDLAGRQVQQDGQITQIFPYCFFLAFSGWLQFKLGRYAGAADSAGELLGYSRNLGLTGFRALGKMLEGVVCAFQEEDPAHGIDQVLRGIDEWRASGSKLAICYFLTHIAEAWLRIDRIAEAKKMLAEADLIAKETGEHCSRAEIMRLRQDIERRCK